MGDLIMKAYTLGVIPARLNSTRFPKKVLYPYKGKPLLYYVWDEVRKCNLIDRLVIATDSKEIIRAATDFGAETILTPAGLKTGSDRTAWVAKKLGGEVIVNVQADNLGLKAPVLKRVLTTMKADRSIKAATLVRRINNDKDLFDPNVVKVACSANSDALWFSRFPLPFLQGAKVGAKADQFKFYGHVGVYFFRKDELKRFANTKQTAFEKAESLEQLRLLEIGGKIKVFSTTARSVSVDCPSDVKKISI